VTVVPTPLPHTKQYSYTFGLVALHQPNHLAMHAGGQFYLSEDAGCTWTNLGSVAEPPANGPLDLVVGPDDTIYGYGKNQPGLIRWQGQTIEALAGPIDSAIYDIAIDPDQPGRLRVALDGGKLQESADGGDSFFKIGTIAPPGDQLGTSYEGDIDPTNLDRAVFGFISQGWWVTDDGGDSWTKSMVETPDPDQAINGFNVEFAPDGSGIVYAQGLEVQLMNSPKRIYRSDDHGFSFAPIVTATPELTLTNGTRMFVHPQDPDTLLFAFGTCIMGIGTYLYSYDHRSGEVTTTAHNYGGFNAIVVSPADPSFYYLGLEGSDNMNMPQCTF